MAPDTSPSDTVRKDHPPDSIGNTSSVRSIVGDSINKVTNLINENIILARYATITSVVLLTSFGMIKSPLFFRYKRVCDIPSYQFLNRKNIHGRIVGTLNTGEGGPIICFVRHLSPVGRLVPRSYSKGRISTDAKDLLKVEIAGVIAPPFYYAGPGKEGPNDFLKRLASNHQAVKCTLLSRKISKPLNNTRDSTATSNSSRYSSDDRSSQYRPNDESGAEIDWRSFEDEQIAVCKVQWKPATSILRKDLASSLINYGRASAGTGVYVEHKSMIATDGSKKLQDIEGDVRYLEQLGKNEYESVKNSAGMWNAQNVRDSRPDLVKEAEFDAQASWYSKLWRKIRKGD